MSRLTINSTLRMNSGYEIPMLGYGYVVTKAFEAGYRHATAVYRNEEPSAVAIKRSSIPRSQIFFTSKVPPRGLSYARAAAQIDASLKLTGLEYIDLMLLHAPYGGREARKGAWKALVEAQEAGKIRSIGVSNYGVQHLNEMEVYIKELETERGGEGKGGKIDVGQWEIHPWLPRRDIVEWCEKRGVVVQAYCPIVRGRRMDDPVLQPLVKKHGKTGAQVLIRWSLQKGLVPLPKSVTPSRIVENADVYDFELDAEDMKTLDINAYEPCAWDPTVAGLEE
ncbi:NADP-dependent oxidoreductase domain-containing protein [Lipomyces doorenjongii]|uniref:NADP-dependent oxidoreductase domain-containing protein n=1 Tax=Lipomyces doorenjongii TaxID=383834 RepID=UPI0034CEEA51